MHGSIRINQFRLHGSAFAESPVMYKIFSASQLSRFSLTKHLIALALFVSSLNALAAPSSWLLKSEQPVVETWGDYLSPNEFWPERAIPIMEKAPTGAYVGVGADRTFNLASLSPLIDRIICLDSDPQIVSFNLYNIFLLRASTSREDYEHLRLKADWSELKQRLDLLLTELDPQVVAAVNEPYFLGIRMKLLTDRGFEIFHEANKNGIVAQFHNAQYMHYEAQFKRLKKLADSNRIEAHIANLKDPLFVKELVAKLGSHLSVLDVSNAWGERYIGKKLIFSVIDQLSPKNSDALFLYTTYLPDRWNGFDYGAVTLKNRFLLNHYVYDVLDSVAFGLLDEKFLAHQAENKCRVLFSR